MTPKGNTGCFRHLLLLTRHLKQVAEEQTKIKQVRSQLKALECDSQHAGQMARWHFEKIQENLRVRSSIDIYCLPLPQLYLT